ncbi:MAG: 4-hydroxy-3-methylbut-2-enyl diphosphate reductase [Steroidobacteraceae bacterium]
MPARSPLTVLLAQPRGFCAGVIRAIQTVEHALQLHGPPVYVVHEIVHNRTVVDELRAKGAVFVERVEEVPRGAVAVLSAHGSAHSVFDRAERRALRLVDAVCPLVAKVHQQARRYASEGRAVILIGHRGHPEVEGTVGSVGVPVHVVSSIREVAALKLPADEPAAYVTQTTLSMDDARSIIDALNLRFLDLHGPELDDICYATQNRQDAVRRLASEVDMVLVVGSPSSSNSNRLCEVAAECGVPAYLLDEAVQLDPAWLQGISRLGLTAGASAPESVVQSVLEKLGLLRDLEVREHEGTREQVRFRLPLAALRATVRRPRNSLRCSAPA